MQLSHAIIPEQIANLPFYVTHCAVHYESGHIVRKEGFGEYQIMQCISGLGTFICDGKTYTLAPHDVVIFNPHIPHIYFGETGTADPWMLNWICFMVKDTQTFHQQLTPQGYAVLRSVKSPKLYPLFEQAVDLLRQDTLARQLEASGVLYQMILELTAHQLGAYSDLENPDFLAPVIAYMKDHLTEDIPIEKLSSLLDISPSYLCRKFKYYHNTSPIKYLIKLRMLRAQELILTQPLVSIKSIAEQCGYHDTAYFCAEFKR
ncbi:MAG: AraC family transcriptional regulator, partial [Cellulosilyticaceae bacterium]